MLVEAQIVRQLGMEGADRDGALAGGHGGAVGEPGDHVDARSDALDARGPDEHTREGSTGEAGDFKWSLERLVLAAVGVAPHGDVDGAEDGLVGPPVEHLGGQEDQPGAGAEDGEAAGQPLAQRLQQPRRVEEASDGGRLAAGDDERVGAGQVAGQADFEGVGPQGRQSLNVRPEAPLQSEDAAPPLEAPCCRARRGPAPGSSGAWGPCPTPGRPV